jgi:GGDEF domain-containing protein
MKNIRNTIASLLIWFFLFYNIERINEPINLASFVYVLAVLCCLVILFFRPLNRVSFVWLFLLSMPPYFFLKFWYRHKLLGLSLPLTITEIAAVGLTIFLSSQLARQLDEIGEVMTNLFIKPLSKGISQFENSQSQIYREIRRARQQEKEVTLLAVEVSDHSLQLNLNRFIRDFENEILQTYINARVGNIFVEKLQITDIVAKRGSHFVILLPDTGKEDTNKVILRLQLNAMEKLGISLKVGAATFPGEATTFEELLECAELKMGQIVPETEKILLNSEDVHLDS